MGSGPLGSTLVPPFNGHAHRTNMTTIYQPLRPTYLDEVFLTAEEVAHDVGRAPRTVMRWCREGKIPGMKIGDVWLLPRASFDAWMSVGRDGTLRAEDRAKYLVLLEQGLMGHGRRVIANDAARLLRMSQRRFADLARDGHLEVTKRGRTWYLDAEHLLRHALAAFERGIG